MEVTGFFKALADETRLRLVNLSLHYELNVNEIVEIMNMGQSRISRHLKILTENQLLTSRRDGFWTFYAAAPVGTGATFIEAVRYLFEQAPLFKGDLARAKRVREERSKEMIRFFDSIAGDWEKLKREIVGDLDINRLILEHISPSSTIVDLGCGTGDLSAVLKEKAERVIGVEKSLKMLDEARRRFTLADGAGDRGNTAGSRNTGTSVTSVNGSNSRKEEKIDLRIGELEHLPLREAEADTAVINMVLHHLADPAAAMVEVHRVLKPGGEFIIVDILSHHREDLRERYGDRWLGFSESDIRKWLENSGFVSVNWVTFDLKKNLEGFIVKSTKKS